MSRRVLPHRLPRERGQRRPARHPHRRDPNQYAIVRTDAGRVEPWAWCEVTPEGYGGEDDAWGATGRPDMTDDYERLTALADLLSNAQHAQIHAGGLLPEIDGNAQVCEAAEREVARLAAAVWPSAEATVGGAACGPELRTDSGDAPRGGHRPHHRRWHALAGRRADTRSASTGAMFVS